MSSDTGSQCPSCGYSLAGFEYYCPICGQQIRSGGQPTAVCRLCGAVLGEPVHQCPECGYELDDPASVILIVEDNLELVEMMYAIFRSAGFHSINCSGTEAVAVASVRRPDAVLLDLMMPDVHGMMVLQNLRSTAATADVPVVLTSASEPLRLLGHREAVQGLIEKPFDPQDLLAELERVITESRARR